MLKTSSRMEYKKNPAEMFNILIYYDLALQLGALLRALYEYGARNFIKSFTNPFSNEIYSFIRPAVFFYLLWNQANNAGIIIWKYQEKKYCASHILELLFIPINSRQITFSTDFCVIIG